MKVWLNLFVYSKVRLCFYKTVMKFILRYFLCNKKYKETYHTLFYKKVWLCSRKVGLRKSLFPSLVFSSYESCTKYKEMVMFL